MTNIRYAHWQMIRDAIPSKDKKYFVKISTACSPLICQPFLTFPLIGVRWPIRGLDCYIWTVIVEEKTGGKPTKAPSGGIIHFVPLPWVGREPRERKWETFVSEKITICWLRSKFQLNCLISLLEDCCPIPRLECKLEWDAELIRTLGEYHPCFDQNLGRKSRSRIEHNFGWILSVGQKKNASMAWQGHQWWHKITSTPKLWIHRCGRGRGRGGGLRSLVERKTISLSPSCKTENNIQDKILQMETLYIQQKEYNS